MRRDRQKPARELMRTLRAAFEMRNAALDAKFDALVITRLEMHARYVFDRAPVSTPHRFARIDIERRAYRLAVTIADDEQKVLSYCASKLVEELARQIRRRMVGPVRTLVATKEQAPIAVFDCGTGIANARNVC